MEEYRGSNLLSFLRMKSWFAAGRVFRQRTVIPEVARCKWEAAKKRKGQMVNKGLPAEMKTEPPLRYQCI
ncbi:hypothetical protein L345_09960, partial [Ophiophagus hannah]